MLSILAGCKIPVIEVESGEVQSDSGTYTPGLAGTVCVHEVTDTSFSENFIAVQDSGWHFTGWNSGGRLG
ncbi:MAG: hypothetical protein ACI9JM_003048 [Halioglobus sp.]|jgi:hypothetical protein